MVKDKKLSADDWKKLRARAETFGHSIGLSCKVPESRDVVEAIYILYGSLPDKIESVIDGGRSEFINFGSDENKALKKKAELEHEGYHVFLAEAKADASGKMIPSYYKNPAKFVEILFHEGFHNNPCNEMHYLIEEAGAYFIGIEGAISFFNIFGGDDFLTRLRNRRMSFNERAQRFVQRYQKRLNRLSKGEVIPASAKDNNALMLLDRTCFLYYPLIRRVHKKVGYIGETRSNLTGLPQSLNEGVKRLEFLASE